MKKWFVWFIKSFAFYFVFWSFVLLFVLLKVDGWFVTAFVASFVGATVFACSQQHDEYKKQKQKQN